MNCNISIRELLRIFFSFLGIYCQRRYVCFMKSIVSIMSFMLYFHPITRYVARPQRPMSKAEKIDAEYKKCVENFTTGRWPCDVTKATKVSKACYLLHYQAGSISPLTNALTL